LSLLSRDYIIIHVDHQNTILSLFLNSEWNFSIEGNSATHGGHQDAQS
jgi:hypothetical protein